MRWRIVVSRRAEKSLARIRDRTLGQRLAAAIDGLAEDPRPAGAVKLAGADATWRLRVGDWRIVYEIEDGRLVVLVVAVAPRGEVYRGL